MSMSMYSGIGYGIQLDPNMDFDKYDEIERFFYENPFHLLSLQPVGDCYSEPDKFIVFRQMFSISPDLNRNLPSKLVQKASDFKMPSEAEIDQAKEFFESNYLPWSDPEWFSFIKVT